MLGLMLQKTWQKKWMNLSLLLGCILLIATAVSFPLYQKAAYDRMLQDEFHDYMSEEGNWPMVIRMTANCQKDKKDTIGRMETYNAGICEQLGVPEYESIYSYTILRTPVQSRMQRDDVEDVTLSLCAMSDLAEHARIIAGEPYSESGIADDGAIEVIVSQNTLTERDLLVGETLDFTKLTDADGNPIWFRTAISEAVQSAADCITALIRPILPIYKSWRDDNEEAGFTCARTGKANADGMGADSAPQGHDRRCAARAHDYTDRADDGEQDEAGGRTAVTGFRNICHTDHKNCNKNVLLFQIEYVILLSYRF